MIELSGVTKIYDHQVVVDDVTLSIPAGGVTSIRNTRRSPFWTGGK